MTVKRALSEIFFKLLGWALAGAAFAIGFLTATKLIN